MNQGNYGTLALPERPTTQQEILHKQQSIELSGDYTLPDYEPEIKRLLKITCNVLPPTQFVGSGSAEFSGSVDYSVLYSDSEGRLCLSTISENYSASAGLDALPDGSDPSLCPELVCFADVSADSVNARVSAPRKLSIRCRLRAAMRAFVPALDGDAVACMLKSDSEKLTGSVPVCYFMRGTSEIITLGDEFIPDASVSAGPVETRIIMPDASALVSELAVADGYVNCRGDVYVKLLLCREEADGEPYAVTKKIPFNAAVNLDGVTNGCECRAFSNIHDISVSSEDGRIVFEVGVSVSVEAQKNTNLSYIRDVYSFGEEGCECVMKDKVYPTALKCFSGNFSAGGTVPLSELGAEPGSLVIDAGGSAGIPTAEIDKGKLVLSGECKYNILMNLGGEAFTRECTLPYRYETAIADASACNDGFECDAEAKLVSVRCRVDSEKIGIDSEIAISGRACGKTHIRTVSEVNFSDDGARSDSGELVVCYPDKGDSLWSVGKRYGKEMASIARANNLKNLDFPDRPESLAGVKFLLIS